MKEAETALDVAVQYGLANAAEDIGLALGFLRWAVADAQKLDR